MLALSLNWHCTVWMYRIVCVVVALSKKEGERVLFNCGPTVFLMKFRPLVALRSCIIPGLAGLCFAIDLGLIPILIEIDHDRFR